LSERREFEDGAFYWVKPADCGWTIAMYDIGNDRFWAPRRLSLWLESLDEIGPCIGKEPPAAVSAWVVRQNPDGTRTVSLEQYER
jgi:hypothetical protein